MLSRPLKRRAGKLFASTTMNSHSEIASKEGQTEFLLLQHVVKTSVSLATDNCTVSTEHVLYRVVQQMEESRLPKYNHAQRTEQDALCRGPLAHVGSTAW